VLAIPIGAVRLGFIILTFVHLLGPLLYAALWLIIPPRPGADSMLERGLRRILQWLGSLNNSGQDRPQTPARSDG
jgi:hypothetical protein